MCVCGESHRSHLRPGWHPGLTKQPHRLPCHPQAVRAEGHPRATAVLVPSVPSPSSAAQAHLGAETSYEGRNGHLRVLFKWLSFSFLPELQVPLSNSDMLLRDGYHFPVQGSGKPRTLSGRCLAGGGSAGLVSTGLCPQLLWATIQTQNERSPAYPRVSEKALHRPPRAPGGVSQLLCPDSHAHCPGWRATSVGELEVSPSGAPGGSVSRACNSWSRPGS